jgi:hypothetical protein
MSSIRQESIFTIHELYNLEPTQHFEAIISVIAIDRLFQKVNKKSRLTNQLNFIMPLGLIPLSFELLRKSHQIKR